MPQPAEKPLRVLHLLLEAAWGGLSRYIIDLANAMAPLGVESIVAADDGEWRDKFKAAHIRFIQIPLLKEKLLFSDSRRILAHALRDQPIDVVHTHYRRATLLARKLRLANAESARVPILYTVHLSHLDMSLLRRWFTDFGDYTHIASEDAREWCVNVGKVRNERICYIPHGVDAERFSLADTALKAAARASLDLGADDLVAAFVGRLEYPKNEHWLLDLAATTRADLPKLKILLAGNGPNMPILRDRIDSENLHDRVRLLGEIDPVPLYHAADALLLPSLREGFSLVCAEAMSCGVPILRTRTTGSRETVVDNVTGRTTLIDHDDFIGAATAFLRDRRRLAEMGSAAAAHIRRNFTHALQVQRTLGLYRTIAASSGRRSV